VTFRAIIVGLVGALLIAVGGFINDRILQLESVTAGHQIPVIVIGLLFLGVVAVNPFLFRLRRRLAFRPAEVAVTVLMMMVSCSIPGRGLLEQFVTVVSMPNYWNRQNPGWRKNRIMQYVPPAMLAGGNQYDEEVMEGFVSGGLGEPGKPVGLGAVPWRKWAAPLTTWGPMIFLLMVAMTCMSLVVHRQWARNERLRYPIAEFTTALIRREPGRGIGPIFRNRMFWIGLAIVLGIRVINGLHRWFPERMIEIPMWFDFSALGRKWPVIGSVPSGGGWNFLYPKIFPICIAFSFFLSSEISLSLGLTQILAVPIAAALMTAGVNIATDYDTGGPQGWHRAGAYTALALILVYIGRRYYWDVLKGALTFRRPRGVEGYAVWAFRFLILSLAGMVAIITALGLDWTLAVLAVGLMMLSFLCLTRMSAETGLFFIQPGWQPFGVMMGMLGAYAMGPQGIILAGMMGGVLCMDQSMGLMPYFTNALKICDNMKVAPARAAWNTMGLYVVAAAVAIPVCIWANYNWGTPTYGWSRWRIPTMSFRPAQTAINKLKLSGQLADSESLAPLERLTNLRPEKDFNWSFWTGVGFVLLFSVLRIRYAWWPLHPVLFLAWTTYPLREFCPSFLIGWTVKTAVTRLGGHKAYRKWMPLMIGAIAAEVVGALVWMAVGAIYYGATDVLPISYRFFPR